MSYASMPDTLFSFHLRICLALEQLLHDICPVRLAPDASRVVTVAVTTVRNAPQGAGQGQARASRNKEAGTKEHTFIALVRGVC